MVVEANDDLTDCWWVELPQTNYQQALDLQLAVVNAKTGGRLDADVSSVSSIPGSLRWADAAAGKIFA